MKEWFNKNILTHKKRYVTIGIVLLILVIFSAAALFTYGFFTKTSANLILSGTADIDNTDLRLRIYLQEVKDGVPIESYAESTSITNNSGVLYIFNPEKTNCINGAELLSVSGRTLNVSYANRGGSCTAYFDAFYSDSDVVIKVYKEQNGRYVFVEDGDIDTSLYKFNKDLSSCTSYGTINNDGTVTFTGSGICEIVYDEIETPTDPDAEQLSEPEVNDEGPSMDETPIDEPSIEEPIPNEPSVDEPSTEEPINDAEPPVEENITT